MNSFSSLLCTKRSGPHSLSLLIALLGAVCFAAANAPQAKAQNGPLIPRNLLTRVPTVRPFLVPELRSYLVANKPKVSPSLLDNAFVLRDGIPAFKLTDGSVRLLMPTTGNETAVKAQPELPDELKAAAPYISLKPKLGVLNSDIVKIGPNYILQKVVDHRSNMTPIRDQGGRGTCVAFASNAALEAFPGMNKDLSEQYSYHMYLQSDGKEFCYNKGTYIGTALNILKTNGTVAENVMPYNYSIPNCSETLPAETNTAQKFKIANATSIPNAGLDGVSIKNPKYLETILDKGYNIVIATQVAWYGAHNNDVIDVVIDSVTNEPAASRGNHAMVIVGYNRPEQYFIVRNSWGTGFGHAGYAYLSYDYLRTYTYEGYYVQSVSPAINIFKVPGPVIGGSKFPGRIKIPR